VITDCETAKIEIERFRKRIEKLRASPAERERILAAARPFDYEAWAAEAGPASAEELADMEAFLRERTEERERWRASQE
jgi:hypothetical protein